MLSMSKLHRVATQIKRKWSEMCHAQEASKHTPAHVQHKHGHSRQFPTRCCQVSTLGVIGQEGISGATTCLKNCWTIQGGFTSSLTVSMGHISTAPAKWWAPSSLSCQFYMIVVYNCEYPGIVYHLLNDFPQAVHGATSSQLTHSEAMRSDSFWPHLWRSWARMAISRQVLSYTCNPTCIPLTIIPYNSCCYKRTALVDKISGSDMSWLNIDAILQVVRLKSLPALLRKVANAKIQAEDSSRKLDGILYTFEVR